MSEHGSSSSDPSVAALVGGLLNDTKALLLQEFTLAKLEFQGELRKTKAAAISFALGAGVIPVGSLLLLLMLVHLLAAFTTIPLWGCCGIIGGVLLVLGLLLLTTGMHTAGFAHGSFRRSFFWTHVRAGGGETAMGFSAVWPLLTETYAQWSAAKPFQLATALAYYTLFSLAPLLLIAIAIAGLVFGRDATEHQLLTTFQGLMGPQGAQAIAGLLHSASTPGSGIVATAVGIVTLLIGAGGVVGQLQEALNTIWEVEAKPGSGIWSLLRTRFISFAMVLGVGFLLLVSLLVSAALAAMIHVMQGLLPGGEVLWHSIEFVVSLGLITLLFALIYKVVPDVDIAWRDVWIGAGMTAVLFTIGKFLLGLYLGRKGVTSSYGAAGSLVLVLLWVYYSGLIFLFGAAFTKVYAATEGAPARPAVQAAYATTADGNRHDSTEKRQGTPTGHAR